MDETWKEVPIHPGYEVSNRGNVRSVDREVLQSGLRGGATSRRLRGRMLKPQVMRTGYQTVLLSGRRYSIHRLVLFAFVGPCPTDMECRHLDGDKANNHLSNLCWGTREENAADTRRLGRDVPMKGERNGNARLSARDVVDIRWAVATGEQSKSVAGRYGTTREHVSQIARGRRWGHVGGPLTHRDSHGRITRIECECGGEHAGIDWPLVRMDHAIRRALGWEVEPGTLAELNCIGGIKTSTGVGPGTQWCWEIRHDGRSRSFASGPEWAGADVLCAGVATYKSDEVLWAIHEAVCS